jgi:hypothetical protein
VCTASWLRRDGALRLLFNRDELRSREPALPPAVRGEAGSRWIAPRDGRAGGTWIAAGERGVALALLNRSEGVRPEGAASRGLLIPALLPAESPEALLERLARHDLRAFAAFRLLALWRDLPHGVVAGWNGTALDRAALDAEAGLLCSSSLGDERVTLSRGTVWKRMRGGACDWNAERHATFHRDHSPEPSAWSVCMHRDDARSVSLTEIELGRDAVHLVYHDAPPCEAGASYALSLPVSVTDGAR